MAHKDREEARAYHKAYHLEHQAKIKAKCDAWRELHKDEIPHKKRAYRYGIAKDVHNLLYYRNMSVQQAADEVIHGGRLRPDDGGLIAVDKDGNIAYACNSDVLFRGGANSDGLFEVFLWMD